MSDHNYQSIKISKRVVYLVAYIAVSIVAAIFLLNSTLISGDDFLLTGNTERILENLTLWNRSNFGSSVGTNMWTLFPLSLIYIIADSLLALDVHYVQFIYVFICFLIGLLSMSYFIKTIGKNPYTFAGLIAVLFYMFNIYTARLLGGPFQFLLPYALTPLFLGLLISSYKGKNYMHGLLSSIVLAFIFGPNLTLGFIALYMAILLATAEFIANKKTTAYLKTLLHILVVFLVNLFFIAWWLVPNIIISRASSTEVANVLTSESFYNLDTGISNILRNLGDWSFFSAHKGQAYVPYASAYAKNPIIIFAGLLPLVALLYNVLLVKFKNSDKIFTVYTVLSFMITAFIIGGTNKEWITDNFFKFAFDNYGILQIFRNTYKFTIVITFAYAIGIFFFLNSTKILRMHKKIKLIIAVLLLLPAFPIFLNKTANPQILVDKFPKYWTDMAQYINNDTDNKRTLLLPDQYFSVFTWDGETKSLGGGYEEALLRQPTIHNTCRGCANPESVDIINSLTTNFKDPNYSKLLNITGITSILQRNDFNYNFYGAATPAEINSTLRVSENISLQKEIGELTYYKVSGSYDHIYAPGSIISTPKLDALSLLGRFNLDDKIAIVEPTNDTLINNSLRPLNYQSAFTRVQDVEVNDDFVVNNFSTPFNDNVQLTLENPSLLLNLDKDLILKTNTESILLAKPKILTDANNLNNSSDYLLGKSVATANYTQPPESGLCRTISDSSSQSSLNVLDGDLKRLVFQISAQESLGCFTTKITALEKNKNYLLWFDYKIEVGNVFGYCVSFNGETCVKVDILTSSKTGWNRHYVEFNSNREENFGKAKLFFYAPAVQKELKSTVRYGNIEAYEISSRPQINATSTSTLNGLKYDLQTNGTEIIPDPKFSQDSWLKKNKSCGLVLETSTYSTRFLKLDNDNIIELESKDTTACTQSANFNVENNSQFLLEIDYKVIDGNKFGYCVYSGNGCLSNEFYETNSKNTWQTYRKIVQLSNPSRNTLSMYLYGSNENESSKVQFKRVSLKQLEGYALPQISISSLNDKFVNSLNINNINKVNDTQYDIIATTQGSGNAVLAFLESYSTAWKMSVNGIALDKAAHFKLNTFANGWVFNVAELCKKTTCNKDQSGVINLKISLEYLPQVYVLPAILTSTFAYLVTTATIFLLWRKHRANR